MIYSININRLIYSFYKYSSLNVLLGTKITTH